MARFLKSIRAALLTILAVAVPNCATNVGSSATNPGLSAIEKCREQGASDDNIDFLFTAVRAVHREGRPASEALAGVVQSCNMATVQPTPEQCTICWTAIVHEVYGL